MERELLKKIHLNEITNFLLVTCALVGEQISHWNIVKKIKELNMSYIKKIKVSVLVSVSVFRCPLSDVTIEVLRIYDERNHILGPTEDSDWSNHILVPTILGPTLDS